MTHQELTWQSKLVLVLVLPFVATHVFLTCFAWIATSLSVALWTLGLSALLGLVTWKARAATAAGAATGATIMASLMFSTTGEPYEPWHTALLPILAVAVLAVASTRIGRRRKEGLGTAEEHHGREASQVAANLGFAALVATTPVLYWLMDQSWLMRATHPAEQLLAVPLAALAEAAADTVSSETGQVIGGRPRMITSLRTVEPGLDGAISAGGTLAGILAACAVAGAGTWALHGDERLFAVSSAGAVFGLLFDSLLGATLESRGWLNNDAVNFLSTASAAVFALGLLATLPPH